MIEGALRVARHSQCAVVQALVTTLTLFRLHSSKLMFTLGGEGVCLLVFPICCWQWFFCLFSFFLFFDGEVALRAKKIGKR